MSKNISYLREILKKNPRDLDDKCDLFTECTPEEYKGLAIFALQALCANHGAFLNCRTDEIGWAAHHITKAIFEEQNIFDPYADQEFIDAIAAICPYYVVRYTKED